MMPRVLARPALLPILAVIVPGCDSGEPANEWEGAVDTLASGAIHARSPARGLWPAGEEWRLVEELRIGGREGDDPEVFGDLSALIVDDAGRMWAMDILAAEMRVFDRDGALVRRVGRSGAGPGEFAATSNRTIPGPDGHIWVKDHRNARWQRFDSAGTFVGSYRTFVPSNIFTPVWGADGRLRDGISDPFDTERPTVVVTGVLTDDDSLVPQDTFEFPALAEGRMEIRRRGNDRVLGRRPIPLTHPAGRVMGPGGDYWTWDAGDAYRIVRHRIEGDTVLILERDYEPVPVPDSVRAGALSWWDPQQFTVNIGPDDIPARYPPFISVFIAKDQHVWVRTNVSGGIAFDVFDPQGRFLGTMPDPGPAWNITITDRHVYGVVRDALGVPYIVRWRIEKPGGVSSRRSGSLHP